MAGELLVRIGVVGLEDLKKIGKAVENVGKDMTKAFTLPIAGIAAAALRQSTIARQAFRGLADSISQSMGRLGDSIARAIDLEGLLSRVGRAVDSLVSAFENLSPSTQTFLVTTLAMVAALGPLEILIGKVALAIVALGKTIVVVATFLIAHPIVAGIIAIVGGVLYLSGALDKVAEAFGGAKKGAEELRRELTLTDRAFATLGAIRAGASAVAGFLGPNLPGSVTRPARTPKPGSMQGPRGPIIEPAPPEAVAAAGFSAINLAKLKDLGSAVMGIGTAFREAYEFGVRKFEQGMVLLGQRGLREANDELANQRELFRVLGGGINTNEQALQTLVGTYRRLLEQGVHPTNEAMRQLAAQIQQQQGFFATLRGLMEAVPPLAVSLAGSIKGVFDELAAGIGNVFAQAIVYGQDFGKAFQDLGKQILASIISGIIQIGVQKLISALFSIVGFAIEAASGLATYAALTYAGVYAANAAIPIIGPGIAAGIAAGAVAKMLAGAKTSAVAGKIVGATIPGAATGGLFATPGITKIAERGPEIVLNKQNVRQFFGGNPGGLTLIIQEDGVERTRRVLRQMPRVLRLHGAT